MIVINVLRLMRNALMEAQMRRAEALCRRYGISSKG